MSALASSVAELTQRRPEDYWALGAWNMPLTRDAPFYIDPRLLERTTVPELKGAADEVYDWFTPVAASLVNSAPNDIVWNAAVAKLRFKETKGVQLGLSDTSIGGRGVGAILAKDMVGTIRVFVQKGLVDPAILGLLAVAQPGFGGDRISDIVLSVTHERFVAYSHRIFKTLGVSGLPHQLFPQYDLPINPHNGYPIVLVPVQILRDLKHEALAFGDLFGDNEDLRRHFNNKVLQAMGKTRTRPTKQDYFRALVDDASRLPEVARAFRNAKPHAYDLAADPYDRLVPDRAAEFAAGRTALPNPGSVAEFCSVVHRICLEFKHFVEHEKALHRVQKGRIPEVEIQRAFQMLARAIGRQINIDVTPESNPGPGPVDFKFSRGTEMVCVVEFKLSDHTSVLPGYSVQLKRYEDAERSDGAVYVVLDFEQRLDLKKSLEAVESETRTARGHAPQVIWISGAPRPSASKDPGSGGRDA